MTAREAKKQYQLREWSKRFTARNRSGLSVRVWCEENEVSARSYYYWLRQVREYAAEVMSVAGSKSEKALVPKGWAELAPAPETPRLETPTVGSGLTVEVGGCRISVSAETDTELLAKTVRALKSV
ncbi:hypothetical protein FACS1894196_4190 [Clostridia bacterium]|nr:hypothetical protein FACS1894196_4190 [Clostridia bacterium]